MTDDNRHDLEGLDRDDLRLLYTLGEALGDMPSDEETRRALADFEAARRAESRRRRRVAAISGLAAAAAVALLLVMTAPWTGLGGAAEGLMTFAAAELPDNVTRSAGGGTVTVATPPATIQTVVLPDGSKVTLGAGSSVEYPQSFDGKESRHVRLAGMARFEVRHDPGKPFVVEAEGVTTRVLGTVFDVSSYKGAARSVTLYSGRVAVDDGRGRHKTVLEPGQRATFTDRRGFSVARTSLASAAGWTHGEFAYDNERLENVMTDIGSWYNVNIVFKSEKTLATRVHFNIPRTLTLQQVVRALNDMGIARFDISGNTVTVS